MNAVDQIIEALNEVFAPMDAEVLAGTKVWAAGRREAIKAKKAEFTASRKWNYEELFAIAGGKTWYNVFDGRNTAMIEEFIEKNCAAIATKRNFAIAAKLQKAGVTEVVEKTFTHTTDGFDGVFVVMTDKGRKVVTVNTIRAGGYNIQCLHLRVLTKVK
ncbi:hypothetical protein EVC03_120 [Rhizobium phage RHph_Y5A]|nr:hypothetical protein EVB53_117 [Rhizobium phage RHph_Y60]QIG73428.1 hypothetical protein EVC03_120 [Rhizobium phage RHph_Y5A]QIG75562.1 hypothetical protein EVC18_120 [Rhizobium phage RHph_Y2_4]